MPRKIASHPPKFKSGTLPPADHIYAALAMIAKGRAFNEPTVASIFGPLPTEEWKQWVWQHPDMPPLSVTCRNDDCGYGWERVELNHSGFVAMPIVRLPHGVQRRLGDFTEKIVQGKGVIIDCETHDSRGAITYRCKGRTIPARKCGRIVRVTAEERTVAYLNALLERVHYVKF